MRSVLSDIGNIPVNSSVIASFFPDIKAKSAKISALEKSGEIIRLRRNLFVLNPDESGVALSVELTANHLLAPSYVSMQTALRHYGLIPEAVYTVQSMTLKESKMYDTPIGSFTYHRISHRTYTDARRQRTIHNSHSRRSPLRPHSQHAWSEFQIPP